MSHQWLLFTFSWLGTVSMQYINTGGPAADTILDPLDPTTMQYPFPYINYFNIPRTDADLPATEYQNEDKENQEVIKRTPENDTDSIDKERLSSYPVPMEHMWTWKRANSIREPSMPKRVRFSPWGGKRSGQMIFKPSSKASKIIFSTSVPELTRIVSNYSPNGESFNLAGFHYIPYLDKRHPIKILALTRLDEKPLRDALPFKSFLDNLPKSFKPGHPYLDVDLKRDGKRKVKFSAWGGKRSAPIIGPIWTPAPQDIQESTLNTILLIRNSQDDQTKKFL